MKTRTTIVMLAFCLVPVIANAQWALNGTPVATAANQQNNVRVIADGSGGVITVWTDERILGNKNIYAQKLDASGVPRWTVDGLAVCTATDFQDYPALCSDGAGGCIIAWEDHRSGSTIDVYAQRITSAGTAQWAANGVVIVNAIADQDFPALVPDGSGGAVMTWQDARNGNFDIYAQRINSAGAVQWAANGKSVCIAAGAQQNPAIVSDGSSGAIIAWEDTRNGNSDIFAQHMSSSGGQQWASSGVALCTQADAQNFVLMAADGAGGAVMAWGDHRAPDIDVYAQRVNGTGGVLWAANGVGVCTDIHTQYMEGVTTDGAGGVIVAWEDFRAGAQSDIYAGRVSAAGIPQWQYNGVPVCTQDFSQYNISIDSDGAGGAVMAWSDLRAGALASIYSQRIDGNGANVWDFDGVAVDDRRDDTDLARIVWSAGAAIMAWRDIRLGSGDDIFAQRVDGRFGAAGHPEPLVTSVADVRNDQGGRVKVNWKASTLDIIGTPGNIPVNRYTVWRAADAASAIVTNGNTLLVNDPSRVPRDFSGKAVYVQHAAATDYYWELVGTQNALKIALYSFSAETRADSVLGNMATHHFMVAAQTENDYVHWPSNEMAGRSVDNLAPLAPLSLTAQRAGSYVHLTWRRVRVADLHNYTVYRKTASGVTPIPINFLADATDTVLTDNNAPTSALYYIVTATDVHANQGGASNEAAVGAATGVGNLPPITSLMVMQNRPNPFATNSSFDLGLPVSSHVSVDVFDVGGRRIASHALGTRPAGWQSVTLEALDDAGRPLASGVYFYRIHAMGQTLTRKMVIAR